MAHIRVLAVEIGPRPAGSDGEAKTVAYLEERFGAAGFETRRMPFERADGGTSFNVTARFAGIDYSQGYLVVGGHHDTVVGTPGGNDNASGVGVVLALSEALALRNIPVEFVGFGAEEYPPSRREHHVGSRAYAAALSDPGIVKAMVSVDMVGAGPSVLICKTRKHKGDVQVEIGGVAAALGIPHELRTEGLFSDHDQFAPKGILAAWLWSGDHPTLHKPSDKFEVVQSEAVDRTGNLLLGWLKVRLNFE